MRRAPFISRPIILFLILSGIFNLLSYSLDQMVVQQEDNIREITREVNLKKTELDSLRGSLNTLEDLLYSTARYSSNFQNKLDNVNHMVQVFNPAEKISDKTLVKIYTKEEIVELSKIYQKDYHDLIVEINARLDETLNNFSYSYSSGIAYELVKDSIQFRRSFDFKKISTDILKNYNFDKVETDETYDENYLIYSKIYKKIQQLNIAYIEMFSLSNNIIQPRYIMLFSNYFETLDEYSSSLSKKNYYILFSILSQILGITFFLLLFRSILITREKK